YGEHACSVLSGTVPRSWGAMKALQATCIVGAITFTGMIHQVGENTPGATVPDAMPEAAVSVETPGAPALSAAVPEASAGPGTVLGAELGSAPGAGSGRSLAQAEIGDDSTETNSVDFCHHDVAGPVPTTSNASNPAPVTQDFRYLIYYVWSELPPGEKPADIVLRSLKDTPVGTPVEEIKRASDAFGLDINFMKAVAKIESDFDPKQRTGSYSGLFQLSNYEFAKYGSGNIFNARDNAIAAANKFASSALLFELTTHRRATISDLYLIHQQGTQGAEEHVNHPDWVAWKSMCATDEGKEKGEDWCKRAIWGNTLPEIKRVWKTVDNLTSAAFLNMWQGQVDRFYTRYSEEAAATN